MLITATEFKANIGKYLDAAGHEDIFVTRKGTIVAKVSNPASDKVGLLDSLVGIAEGEDLSAKQARAARLVQQ